VSGPVAIRLLGPVRVVTVGHGEVGPRGHGARLLAWLALRPGRTWAADDLIDRLWPAGPPPTARTALQGHVAKLRGVLADVDGATIETVGSAYVLHVDADRVDAHRFDALVGHAQAALGRRDPRDAVRALTDARDLWSGPALANVRDDPLLGVEAAALDARRTDAEDDLARALIAGGDIKPAVELLERLVAAEPLRERRWGQLMVALHRDGRQTDALRAYQRAATALAEEAGLEPGRELRRLERAILVQDPSLDGTRSWASAAVLPAPLTRIVGRDPERAEVRERLRSSRLVTVVGPGGVGKTATALDVAAGIAPALPDGVVVVDLAGAAESSEVGEVVAGTFGVSEGLTGEPVRRTASALEGRELLIVLDNCEHVLDEAASVAIALLRASAAIRILATSQEPLHVAGEAIVTLEPLAVPDEGARRADVQQAGACQLLAQRLEALGRPPTSDDDWLAVGAAARGAGGLPLALEVAAAWARTESLAVVADRLGGEDVLLAEPPAGAGRRGLGVALDAAVGRLSGPARHAYAAASLFPAWFGADAVAAAADLPRGDARAALAEMVDVSLTLVDPTDQARFRLLPPVRRHAALRLAADGCDDRALRGVTDWCLATAEELDRAVRGPGLIDAVARFTADLPTLRMALRRALDDGRVADAVRLFERLVFCWGSSPAAPEAGRWGAELLQRTDVMPAGDRVRVEVMAMQAADTFEAIAAHLADAEDALRAADAVGDTLAGASARLVVAMGLGWRGERLDRAAELAAEARAAMLGAGEAFWAAEARSCEGLLALRVLDLGRASALLEEALAEHQAVGASVGIARTLLFIGFARRFAGDLDGARRAFGEAQRLLTGGRVTTWLRATVALGHTELAAGDLAAAESAFRAAHARASDVGDQRITRSALVGIATAARRRDGDERAAPLFLAAARHALSAGDRPDAAAAATGLADVLEERGLLDHAAVLLGAAEAEPAPTGIRIDFGSTVDAGAVARRLTERIGAERLVRLQSDGRLLGLEAALAQAEASVDRRSDAPQESASFSSPAARGGHESP
jgi:predicted ATPase/DNA-binding SARP family transcriptional activator